jgi:MFS family permease
MRRSILPCLLALFFIIPAVGLFRLPSTSMEESSILQYASMTAEGHTPTKDFWTEYGPLNVYAPAAVFTVTGPSLFVERLVGLVYRAILLVSLFAILRHYSRRIAILGSALMWWLLAPWGAMAYAWIGGLGMALAALAVMSTSSPVTRRRLFAASLCAGIALSFRPDLIIAVACGFGIAMWPHRSEWKAWVGGLTVGLSPYVLLLVTAGPSNIIRNLIVDPLVHLRDGRALPFPPSWKWNAEFFSRVQQYVDALTNRNWYGAPLVVQIAELFWFLVVIALLIAVATWQVRRTDRVMLAVGVFSLFLATNIYQRADISHMRLVGALWIGITPLAISIVARRWFQDHARVSFAATGTVALLLVLVAPSISFAAFYQLAHRTTTPTLTYAVGDRDVIASSATELSEMRLAVDLVGELSKPGDRIFQGPSDLRLTNYNEPSFYWLLPSLVPSTYYLEMNPGISNAPDSRLANDVATSDILLLSNRFENFSEPNTSTVPGNTAANEVVANNFCVAGATKWYTVLLNRENHPVSKEISTALGRIPAPHCL